MRGGGSIAQRPGPVGWLSGKGSEWYRARTAAGGNQGGRCQQVEMLPHVLRLQANKFVKVSDAAVAGIGC